MEGIVADVTPKNALELLGGFSVIVDGTDNFETRLLLNDAAISMNVSWIYAAAVGSYGVTMTIRPGETACLACLLEDSRNTAASGAEDTCDTIGVSGRRGRSDRVDRILGSDEVAGWKIRGAEWKSDFLRRVDRQISIHSRATQSQLPRVRAGKNLIIWTETPSRKSRCAAAIPCRSTNADASWIWPSCAGGLTSGSTAACATMNFCCVFRWMPYEMTVFADGRAVIKGTKDPAVARSLYSRLYRGLSSDFAVNCECG